MSTPVAEIFRKAVVDGHYSAERFFMCNALDRMYDMFEVTRAEHEAAHIALNLYFLELGKSSNTLFCMLSNAGIIGISEAAYRNSDHINPLKYRAELRESVCTPIYLDWDNRPRLTNTKRIPGL